MKTVDELLSLLTLEEKVALVAGYKFMRTNPVPRLDIPSIKTSDGPHGLRAQTDGGDNGVTNSLPATCFPTASCSANTWHPELLKEMGNAMAEEAKFYDVSVNFAMTYKLQIKLPFKFLNFEIKLILPPYVNSW